MRHFFARSFFGAGIVIILFNVVYGNLVLHLSQNILNGFLLDAIAMMVLGIGIQVIKKEEKR